MTSIEVRNRKGEIKLKMVAFETESVGSIKERICEADPRSCCVSHNGVPVVDSTLISGLGQNVILTIENEIEFSSIAAPDAAKEGADADSVIIQPVVDAPSIPTIANTEMETAAGNSEVSATNESAENSNDTKYHIHNGRRYAVLLRRRRYKLLDFVAFVRGCITRELMTALLMASVLYLSNNTAFLAIWMVLSLLTYISHSSALASTVSRLPLSNAARAAVMFFISFICINHAAYFAPE
ncbi:hypothetical protein PAPHI01_1122 [Pancytospora philotis]|nr:hypothetical protein PAPHI01_1122 [Pancytospora philotis]